MLPRSEKAYTFFLIGIMSIVVILSVGVGIHQMKGSSSAKPDYKAAGPTAFVTLPPDYIVDETNLSGNPISDGDFELFHKQTRLLSPLIVTKGVKEAEPFLYDNQVKDKIQTQVDSFYSIIKGQQHSASKDVEITNPSKRVCDLAQSICEKVCEVSASDQNVYICQRASTSATVQFFQFANGQTGSPSIVSITWEWVKTPQGWKIIDATPDLSTGEGDTSIEQNNEPETTNADPDGSIGEIDQSQNGTNPDAEGEVTQGENKIVGPSDGTQEAPADEEEYTDSPDGQ